MISPTLVSHSDVPPTSIMCVPFSGGKYCLPWIGTAATCMVEIAKQKHRCREFQNWKWA